MNLSYSTAKSDDFQKFRLQLFYLTFKKGLFLFQLVGYIMPQGSCRKQYKKGGGGGGKEKKKKKEGGGGGGQRP